VLSDYELKEFKNIQEVYTKVKILIEDIIQ